MDFFELLKISTAGPPHLRLNEDVLRVIHEFTKAPRVALACGTCRCALLTDRDGRLYMETTYFCDASGDAACYTCYGCSRFRGQRRFMSAGDAEHGLECALEAGALGLGRTVPVHDEGVGS